MGGGCSLIATGTLTWLEGAGDGQALGSCQDRNSLYRDDACSRAQRVLGNGECGELHFDGLLLLNADCGAYYIPKACMWQDAGLCAWRYELWGG